MLRLKEFKEGPIGFPSLINYFAFIEEGIVLNKDGSFTACFYYCGPDMESSLGSEHDSLSAHINAVLCKLSTGWIINIDLIRVEAIEYPQNQSFPDPTSLLIELERKQQYERQGSHFDCIYGLSLTYKPSKTESRRIRRFFITDDGGNSSDSMDSPLEYFKRTLNEIEDGLSARLSIRRMNTDEVLRFLQSCITGRNIPFNFPKPPAYLNHILGAYDFVGGTKPCIDGQHIGIVATIGFPLDSFSGMLDVLNTLPFRYRFSNRFIVMDQIDAEKEIKKIRTKYHNKQLTILNAVTEIIAPGAESKYTNNEAIQKASDADAAVTEAQEGIVRYGYYTAVVVVMNESRSTVETQTKEIKKLLDNSGFPARIEEFNAIEAYLGSLPAHSYPNIRKPIIHTFNLSHIVPVTSSWAGLEHNPNPRFPTKSPPLFYGTTTGSTPFRFNLHVSDVGHTMILGPTGAGKSTLLSFLAAQFLRYDQAQIFCFDKGMSLYPLVKACGGNHYHILNTNDLSFCPLKNIHEENEKIWACQWIEELLTLQGVTVDPMLRNAISDGVESLKADPQRTLSNLYTNIQSKKIKEALSPFVEIQQGMMANLLDSNEDQMSKHYFQVFEVDQLMNTDKKHSVPVLSYLFHQIERRLDGRPTLIVIDEAWLIFDNPLFREKMREWLKVLRKANASVVFATQSITDVLNSPIKDVVIDSCPTKIFLPHAGASTDNVKGFYESFGLNDRQIKLISCAIAKQQYYYTSPLGQRLIELELQGVALSFTGASRKSDIQQIQTLEKQYGDQWPYYWLCNRKLELEAEQWRNLKKEIS